MCYNPVLVRDKPLRAPASVKLNNARISIKNPLKFVPWGTIDVIQALAQAMHWRLPDDKPLYDPMMVSLLTHTRITRPQWVKYEYTLLLLNDKKEQKPYRTAVYNKERHFEASKLIGIETRWPALWQTTFLQHFRQWKPVWFSSFTEVCS